MVDEHSAHMTLPVVALCGARGVILIRLVAHKSHLVQPLDLCVFALFKIFCRKERKPKSRNEKRNSKDLTGIASIFQEHDHSDGSVRFRASWFSLEFR
jgi:hypothetical protein